MAVPFMRECGSCAKQVFFLGAVSAPDGTHLCSSCHDRSRLQNELQANTAEELREAYYRADRVGTTRIRDMAKELLEERGEELRPPQEHGEDAEQEAAVGDAAMTSKSATPGRHAPAIRKRYVDAYRVAGTTVFIGNFVKILAAVSSLAVLFGLPSALGERFFPLAFTVAIPLGVLLFVLGVLISAQGQMVRAVLDNAVHTSPFLTDAERATIIRVE